MSKKRKKKDFYQKWIENELKRDFRYYGLTKPLKVKTDGIFALCSDLHIGSRYSAEELIEEFFDEVRDRDCKVVFIAGDYVDGVGVYRGQLKDLKLSRLDEQVKRFESILPKKIRYYVIDGNHEEKSARNLGIRVGDLIKRKDVKYCGEIFSRFRLDDKLILDIVHPRGAPAYSIGYPLQKYLRQTDPKFHPDILDFGHFHRHLWANAYGVEGFINGGFEYPNDFIMSQHAGSDLSGWIIEYEKDDKKLKLRPELIRFI